MPKLETVKPAEQWLVEVNGGYDILFAEVQLAADAVDGEVIAAPVAGIVSKGGSTGDFVRVMVRGNPSKVALDLLTGDASGLAALDILAV